MSGAAVVAVTALALAVLMSRKGRSTSYPVLEYYAPGSAELSTLLSSATMLTGLPNSWASSSAMHELVRKESGGWVGRPNYTWGTLSDPSSASRWPSEVWRPLKDLGPRDVPDWVKDLAKERGRQWSSATGLGQLLTSNAEKYYPSGMDGIGDPLEEAAGMLMYVADRYGDPDTAYAMHGRSGTYTHGATGETKSKTFTEGY